MILVTGGAGFIGSHLVERLLELDYQVRVLVLYDSLSSIGWLESLKENPNLEIVFGDIRDYNCVYNLLQDVSIVYHLAALVSIPYSYKNPRSYVDTNIIGTINLLEAARNYAGKIERILITSTSEVYGSAVYTPMDELHPLQAQSPYSATKISADKIAISFYNSFDLPVTIVRPFNAYGPRQSTRAVIPRMISQLISNPKGLKLGNLTTIRDFNYVGDIVEAFLLITKSANTIGEEINVCSGNGIRIDEVLELLSDKLGISYKLKTQANRIRPVKSEVTTLIGDNSKIKKMVGWNPSTSLVDGLESTINFYLTSKVADDDEIL
jgi:NAD dependent epimerase/dehydratase